MNKSSGTVLITGSAKRIGSKIALFLANMGYDIIVHYNQSQEKAKKLQDKINQKTKSKCHIIKADLTDENQIQNLATQITNNFKDWNILINNASIFNKSGLLKSSVKDFNDNFNIHLKAPFILSQIFANNCIKKNIAGNIINMIDKNITRNNTKYFSYLLSKKSLNDFTKIAALQLAPKIRVNAIAPGYIEASEKTNEAKWEEDNLIKKIPLGKQGNSNNVNQAIEYIINNNYITGQTLFVDGGASLIEF